jgi:hypothetical protein
MHVVINFKKFAGIRKFALHKLGVASFFGFGFGFFGFGLVFWLHHQLKFNRKNSSSYPRQG